MNNFVGLILISDVSVLAIISNAFWLTILVICLISFRSEIRALLGSLSSVSIAGGHFELADKALTLRSYAILSNILLDMLANGSNNDKWMALMSPVSAQQLGKFAIKYLNEAKKEDLNLPLIRNIAYIVGRIGSPQDSLSLYDFLIEKNPGDPDMVNNKGLVLFSADPAEAKKLYAGLMNESPGRTLYRYNYAISNLYLDNYDDAVKDLAIAFRQGYRDPGMETRPAIQKLARNKPEEYKKLIDLIADADKKSSTE